MKKLTFCILFLILLLSCQTKKVIKPFPEPIGEAFIYLCFDDGYASDTLAFQLMDSLGFLGNIFVICSWVNDTRIDIMGWSQIEALYQKGYFIGNHTWSHKRRPDSVEVNSCYDCLVERGYDSDVLAYPMGEVDSATIQIVRQNHIAARIIGGGFEDYLNDEHPNRYRLKSFYVNANTSLEEVESWVDLAISEGKVLILTYHGFCIGIDCEEHHMVNLGAFRKTLIYLHERKTEITVSTFKDAFSKTETGH